ncbi:DUF1427 family protein [Erwinia sp. P7711]|uniref:DUF1427 family protein n=1 Tax=Erwinia sp. P7711 TaxID=3141451 RepID=UPI00318DD6C5
MSPLLISLGAGVLIGLVYALLNVRSPAPPAVALVGLLGMIIGGQLSLQFSHKEVAAQHTLSLSTEKALPTASGKKAV